MADGPALRLVVLGDSTAFTDHRGQQLPSDAALYPNVCADRIGTTLGRPVEVTTIARAGVTVRDVARQLTKDRHVMFDVLVGADAVVVGVGGFDHVPAGVPAVVDAVLPYLRPAPVRRRARRAVRSAYPWLVRAGRARRPRTPSQEFDRHFDQVLLQVRSLARGAAGVVLGPTSQRSDYYAHRDDPHADGERRQLEAAARHGFAGVACWPLVTPYLDDLNVDGIHWPHQVHAAVGEALADALVPQLRDPARRPPTPRWD